MTTKSNMALVPFSATDPTYYRIETAAHGAPWSLSTFQQCVGHLYRTRALLINGEPVGFTICYLVADEVTLMNIAVHPKHQGNGYGKLLMQDILDFISDRNGARQRTVFLEVREHNTSAIALYKALGFNDIGRRPGYYPPIAPSTTPETAIVMRLPPGALQSDHVEEPPPRSR